MDDRKSPKDAVEVQFRPVLYGGTGRGEAVTGAGMNSTGV